MSETVQNLNYILAIGGILVLLFSSVLVFDLFSSRIFKGILSSWGILLGFIFALGSSLMTLVYSEGFGFVPCGLCWLERVFLYPQVFILGMALFYKEKAQYCPGEICDAKSKQAIQKTSIAQLLVVFAFIVFIFLTAFLFNGKFKEKPHDLFGIFSSAQSK